MFQILNLKFKFVSDFGFRASNFRCYAPATLDLHALSTPPTFILSQDQTLKKEVKQFRATTYAATTKDALLRRRLEDDKIENIVLFAYASKTFCTLIYSSGIEGMCSCHMYVFNGETDRIHIKDMNGDAVSVSEL